MNKQPEVTEATRQRFIEAFLALYRDKPIERITVREISDAAGYNRITFYRYFNSIYDLHDNIVRMMYERIRPKILDGVFKSEEYSEFCTQVSTLKQEWGEYFRIMLKPGFYARVPEDIKEELLWHLCMEFGLKKETVQVSYILDCYMNSVLTLIYSWLSDPKGLSEEEFAEMLWGFLHKGVLQQLNLYRQLPV